MNRYLLLCLALVGCGKNSTSPVEGDLSSSEYSSSSIPIAVSCSAAHFSSRGIESSSLTYSSQNHGTSSDVGESSMLEVSSSSSSSSSSSEESYSESSSSISASISSSSFPLSLDTAWGSLDYDGQTYRTIRINKQTWFMDNLNVGTQVNGGSMFDAQEDDGMVEKFCYNDNGCEVYGGLYQWHEAMALPHSCKTEDCTADILPVHQGICPDGWHIPTRSDWDILVVALGGPNAGKNAKENMLGLPTWENGMNNGNPLGFSALPAGIRVYSGAYDFIGTQAKFWVADQKGANESYHRHMDNQNPGIDDYSIQKGTGMSVRCLKNSNGAL